jgi:tight adherence protein B
LLAAAEAAPVAAAPFRVAAAAARAGGDAAAPLLAEPDLAALGHAWQVAERSGAALAGVLARVGTDLSARTAQRRAVRVATAGARSSAVLLACLPAVGLALAAAMGARPLAFLLGSPAGRVVSLLGVVLDAAGTAWTVRLVDAAQRAAD